MASWTSSAFNTSNAYIKYKITIVQNSQNIENNTSNVTVRVRAYRTNTGYTTYGSGTVSCNINGKMYSASINSSQKITNSGINLFNKTLNISHDSNGNKKLTVKASISHDRFTTSTNSYSHSLTMIPRKSTLTVSNGTLNVAQTLTINKKVDSFTHTIIASCGTLKYTVCSKTSNNSVTYTPPLTFANQNTTGTTVSVTYTIITYNGNNDIGSNSYTVSCNIPTNIKPSCSVTVSDNTGYLSTYGSYIQGKSKIKVDIKTTIAYGSAIDTYVTSLDKKTYKTKTFTTNVISTAGDLKISSTVTDKRGRSGTSTNTVKVLAYNVPVISKLSVNRCDENGTTNQGGSYAKITFSSTASNLNNVNKITYTLQYKYSSSSTYDTTTELSNYSGLYKVSNGSYIFPADTSRSYSIKLTITDGISYTSKVTNVSTGFTLLHFGANANSIGIGKIVEQDNVLDIGLPVKFSRGMAPKTLWSGEYHMTVDQTISLTEKVSDQLIGICLVFSAYTDGVSQNFDWNYFVVPKSHTIHRNGQGIDFHMCNAGFSNIATKYVYIYDDKIVGNSNNSNSGTGASGITFNNSSFILRAVLGI